MKIRNDRWSRNDFWFIPFYSKFEDGTKSIGWGWWTVEWWTK